MQAQHAGHVKGGTSAHRAGWLASAIVSGFAASIVMLIAFLVAYNLALLASTLPSAELRASELQRPQPIFGQLRRGNDVPLAEVPGGELMRAWLHNLTHNRAIETAMVDVFGATAIYLMGGIFWAILYARLAEPRLSGPGWVRGAKFSILPGILSVLVVLPLVGGGPFGWAFGAGPLPLIGNLLLHLVYGITLGQLYGPWGDLDATTLQPRSGSHVAAAPRGDRMVVRGLVIGLVVGTALGVIGPLVASLQAGGSGLGQPVSALVLLGAVMGIALGGVIGTFLGLSAPDEPRQTT
jgi:hypothetical protein